MYVVYSKNKIVLFLNTKYKIHFHEKSLYFEFDQFLRTGMCCNNQCDKIMIASKVTRLIHLDQRHN